MELPQINYQFWLNNWPESIGEEKVYSNKNLMKFIQYDENTNECTKEIFNLTKHSNLDKETVLRVIDLIYSWGGRSGRMFYSRTKGELSPREELQMNEKVYELYLLGILKAKNGEPESYRIFKQIRGIGSSYASKHAHFWSMYSQTPLIIIDSKIAGALGYVNIDKLEKVSTYENTITLFKNKAEEIFRSNDPSQIERALFAFHNYYFLNDNSGWKPKIDTNYQDYNIAKNLSKILFE